VLCKEKGIPPIPRAAQFKDRIPVRHHFEDIDSERGGLLHPQLFRIIFIPIIFIHGKEEFGNSNICKLLLSYQRLL